MNKNLSRAEEKPDNVWLALIPRATESREDHVSEAMVMPEQRLQVLIACLGNVPWRKADQFCSLWATPSQTPAKPSPCLVKAEAWTKC